MDGEATKYGWSTTVSRFHFDCKNAMPKRGAMIFLMSFLGCLAAVALWKWFEKRNRRVDRVNQFTVHEVFDKSSDGISHASTAFIDSRARRFQVRFHFDTSSGVRNYDYRSINGAVYDAYDDAYYVSPRPRYDVY